MSASSALLQISTHADTCNASGLSGQHSSITPTHATLSATGYILLQPERAKATAWSLLEHLHGHPGQGLATGRVDLAGHDQGARLVLRDFQFCEACAQVGWSS